MLSDAGPGAAGGEAVVDADDARLAALGYAPELARGMTGFTNFAVSLSTICVLAGGITSLPLGLSAVGGASIGWGWPISCAFSLCVAAAMAEIASAFPTAGGLYHWAAILGGRGWGWLTAWCNLAGLVTVLAAIDVGAWQFAAGTLGPSLGLDLAALPPGRAALLQGVAVSAIAASQALVNHLGIRLTARLTDLSGWWILVVSALLAAALFAFAPAPDLSRAFVFSNYSGPRGGDVWPAQPSVAWLFLLGFLLPAYTVTGFDASAHAAEETAGAEHNVPRGIVRSVLVSGAFGWVLLLAFVRAIPDMDAAVARGGGVFAFVLDAVMPPALARALYAAIAVAQYLCGLATVTSASRMTFAFARDGGLPMSAWLRRVSPSRRTPAAAIWTVTGLAVLFTLYTPVYATITAVCTILLYASYVLPIALGLAARGRTWTRTGPWSIGRAFAPLAAIAALGCVLLVVIGVQPPNDAAIRILAGALAATAIVWLAVERRRFAGPPAALLASVSSGTSPCTPRASPGRPADPAAPAAS